MISDHLLQADLPEQSERKEQACLISFSFHFHSSVSPHPYHGDPLLPDSLGPLMACSVQVAHHASMVSSTFCPSSLPSQSCILSPSSETSVAYLPKRHLGSNELLGAKGVMADNELNSCPF